jgi:hypothetical protein
MKPLLPGIHRFGASSANTMPSKCDSPSSIVKVLPPFWVRLAGATQATSVLSRMLGSPADSPAYGFDAAGAGALNRAPPEDMLRRAEPPGLKTGRAVESRHQ